MKIEKKAKGKGKGKAILGIVMAAIMLASVFVAMVPIATAVAPWITVDKATDSTTWPAAFPVTYTFTVTNLDTIADAFMVTYTNPDPANWNIAPAPGFVSGVIAAGGTWTFTLMFTPLAPPAPFAGAQPISVPVTVISGWPGDATTKTIGCYMTPLIYNGLRNVIFVAWAPYDPSNPADPNYVPPTPVIIGQDLDLSALPAAQLPATIIGDPTNPATAGQIFQTDAAGMFDSAAMTVQGTYYINPVGGSSTCTPAICWGVLVIADPTMNLYLRASGTSVSSITQGTPLQIHFTNNLDQNDMVTLKIIDPNGNQIKSTPTPAQKFSKINVRLISQVYGVAGIDTTNWKIGTYTFQVKTDKTVADGIGARGLDASSGEKTLTIRPSEIGISADKTSVVKEERVKLTVTGVLGHEITIDSSDWGHTLFPGGLDDNPAADTTATFADTIDADGKRIYAVEFTDTGSYTITVTDTSVTPQMTDTVDITVTEKGKVLVSIATDKVEYSSGDVMNTSIHLSNPTDETQNLLFKWYLGIPDYYFWTKIMETEVHLAADSDLTFAIPIPVGDWGAESFCGYHIASLTNTTTKKVVGVDSAAWIYMPGAVSESKPSAEIAKEIIKEIEGVELPD